MSTKSTRSSGTQHNLRGVAQGTTLVGQGSGLPIDEIVDSDGIRRLAVDSTVNLTTDNINVNVDLDVPDDGVHIGDINTGSTLAIETNGSINVNVELDAGDGDSVSISGHVNPIFSQFADSLTTASFEQIFTYTATAGSRLILIETTAATNCIFRVKLNGTIIKQKRSSPVRPNVEFNFTEHRPLTTSDVLVVEAKASRFYSNNAPYDTFTSIEGYFI